MSKEKNVTLGSLKKATMVAELSVTSSLGTEVVRTFDTAWHRALELPTPVTIKLLAFIRKD